MSISMTEPIRSLWIVDTVGEVLEPLCRQLLYKIHNKRYELLGLMENKKKENGKKN